MTSLTINRGLAFLMGFGVALLPSYGPFIGLLFFFGARWTLRRSDALWLLAALVLALPLGLHEGPSGLLFGSLQVLAAWLVYKAFSQMGFGRRALAHSQGLGLGLLSGLGAVVALSWLRIDQLNFGYAKTVAQAIVWDSHPALYGHTILALGALIAILFTDPRKRMASLALAALGILVTGSREAAIAWVVVAVALVFIGHERTRRAHLLEALLLALMLAIAAGLGPALGWGRVGFLVDLLPPAEQRPNLVQGSEIAAGDWWDALGVAVKAATVDLGGSTLTRFELRKTQAEEWLRLQQVIPIRAGLPYTLSAWIRASPGRPGLQGWGQPLRGEPWFVAGALEGGSWRVHSRGPGRVLDAGVLGVEGDWRRVFVSFIYEGEAPLYWSVGLAPDQRQGQGAPAAFAGFQIEEGEAAGPYRPGPASRGLGLRVARLPYWEAAWVGFLERPLWGWGRDSFAAFFDRAWPERGRLHHTPAHVHNLPLGMLFERGLVGLLGLGLFLGAMSQRAWRKRDWAFLAVLSALLIANLFDSTLLYGGVLYPLAAVAGWRAAHFRVSERERSELPRQAGVGLALPVTDYLMTVAALYLAALAHVLLGRPLEGFGELWRALAYALLLWPAMYWREGLYPGYGLTPPRQLQRQVTGALYAGLIVAAGTVLFGDLLAVSRSVLLLTVLFSMVLCPLGRALMKRLLHRAGLWGRPVVILGAGATGQRIARALQRRPLEGLMPVALFDDDDDKQGTVMAGLRVRGRLDDANAYAEAADVNHAIVAIPRVSRAVLSDLIGRKGRAFRQVQFVPDLAGLPATDVYASSLDEGLALEVRNGLHSERNRLVKRVLDLVLGALALLFSLPLLVLLYLWVRSDSPGPAFHQSERLGQDGRVFRCLKFRTMFTDAEARLTELLTADPGLRGEYERFHKLEGDPRITRAGRFLRRYSLDELPQLANVLAGEMSLVGPRPYLAREYPDMNGYGETILEAKPGITGHWQVSGRNFFTFGERLELEAHYVRNWSIWWDIIILVQTVIVVLTQRGAK
ncbi:MAG: undecaprenyl-phosphate galactose phosphotransferase WbaP [Deinococcota bacterium]|nr:undecaprenyl-phosphate galactose phosphotransferase WbaP [Deinococcota bacterium]